MTQMTIFGEEEKTPVEPADIVAGEPAKVHLSPKLKEYRRNVWDKACQRVLLANPLHALKVLVASVLAGEARHIEAYLFEPFYRKVATADLPDTTSHQFNRISLSDCLTHTDALEPDKLNKLLTAMSVVMVPKLDETKVQTLLQWLDADLGEFWRIEEPFLAMLTKEEIVGICTEVGVKGYMGASFGKHSTGKKSDFIGAILGCGFDFTGRTPAIMRF